MDEKVNLRLHNAMIEVAVCEFWENKIAETDWSNDGDHEFSERHTAKIKTVIKRHKAQARRRRLFRATKRVAVVVLILFAVSSVVLVSSAEAREAVRRLRENIVALFMQENPGVSPVGDEFMDYQTGMQIEQLESAISNVLATVELPSDTTFEIHIDGWLNVTISGIDEANAAKIKPYIEPMAGILSTAYASENKNQLYYVQSIIWAYEQLKGEDSFEYYDTIREYRRTIREYMFANNITSDDEIMSQTRNISFTGGKLIFEVK